MTKNKGVIKFLVAMFIICVVLFFALYGIILWLSYEKTMYTAISDAVTDQFENDYIEKEDNFLNFYAYPELDFSNELSPYKTISKAISNKFDYYSPYFLHITLTRNEVKELDTLLKQHKTDEADLKNMLSDLNSRFVSHAANPTQSSENTIKNIFFSAFLPKYSSLISSKQKITLFLENKLQEYGLLLSPYISNLTKFQNILIEFGINYTLPSISLNSMANNSFDSIITNPTTNSLAKTTDLFNIYRQQNRQQLDTGKTKAFETTFLNITKIFNTAQETYTKLSHEEQNAFLKSNKLKPTESLSPADTGFAYNFICTVFASNGTLIDYINNSAITDYFNI